MLLRCLYSVRVSLSVFILTINEINEVPISSSAPHGEWRPLYTVRDALTRVTIATVTLTTGAQRAPLQVRQSAKMNYM